MADRPQCTFNPDAALRESYLHELRPQERDLLSRLAGTVLEFAREGGYIDGSQFPPTFVHVRAIAADLRFLDRLLLRISSCEEGASHHLWHARLLVLASQIAPRVGELTGELEAQLGAIAGEATDE